MKKKIKNQVNKVFFQHCLKENMMDKQTAY